MALVFDGATVPLRPVLDRQETKMMHFDVSIGVKADSQADAKRRLLATA